MDRLRRAVNIFERMNLESAPLDGYVSVLLKDINHRGEPIIKVYKCPTTGLQL